MKWRNAPFLTVIHIQYRILRACIIPLMTEPQIEKAAWCGEPSYVWRDGQQRRLDMIIKNTRKRIHGKILDNGCGVGMYVEHLTPFGGKVFGLEYDFERGVEAGSRSKRILNAANESLPLPSNTFDLILSHEVLEHVQDDSQAVREMIRVLKPGGRVVIFVPNCGYPFETHGIYWKGQYKFGNIPLINYLPRRWRNKFVPHVKVYSKKNIYKLFKNLPVKFITRTIIFGAYDNIIARYGYLGKALRSFLHFLEKTPLNVFGLSHFWVVEKNKTAH